MIKTALFFIFFCLVTLIHTTSLFLNQAICKLFNKEFSANKAHQRATAWGRSLFHLTPGWSIKVSGSEHLEKLKQEPAVIVSNHESATDILAFYQLNLQFRWIAKQKIFTFPLIGSAMRAAQYVGVKRGDKNSHQQALEESRAILKSGISMLFFPEGTRSTTGEPKKFKIGAFKLAIEENLPILPVVLTGSAKLMRKGTLAPNKANIDLQILPPEKHHPDEDIQSYTRRIESLIKEKHAESKKLGLQETQTHPELRLNGSEK